MTTLEEFKQFSSLTYIDYNVMSYFNSFRPQTDRKEYINAFNLYILLQNMMDTKKVCTPYSVAHLMDVTLGTQEIDNKLNVLKMFTNGWCVSEDMENIRLDKCLNINDHYNSVKDGMDFTKTVQDIFSPLIEMVFNNFDYMKGLPIEMQEKIRNISFNRTVRTIYDLFQYNYILTKALNERIMDITNLNCEQIIDKINNYIKSSWLNKSLEINSIDEFEIYFYQLYNNINGQSKYMQKIIFYSFLSDFIGITNEKIKNIKSETFSPGMTNDMVHLSYALRCQDFVTNDHQLRKKAIFCKKMTNSSVRIFLMDDYIDWIINSYCKKNFPDKNHTEFKILIKENGEKEMILKSYVVDYERKNYC